MKTWIWLIAILAPLNATLGQPETAGSHFQLLSVTSAEEKPATTNQPVEIHKDDNQGPYGGWGFVYTETEFRATRKPLFDIIRELNPHSGLLLVDEAKLSEDKYDVRLQSTNHEEYWKMFEHALRKKFNLVVNIKARAVENFELQTLRNPAARLTKAAETEQHGFATIPEGFAFKAYSMKDLAAFFNQESLLSPQLGLPVFDKTGLQGEYSFNLAVTPFSPKREIIQALNQIGLTLKKATNTMDVLVVERLK